MYFAMMLLKVIEKLSMGQDRLISEKLRKRKIEEAFSFLHLLILVFIFSSIQQVHYYYFIILGQDRSLRESLTYTP